MIKKTKLNQPLLYGLIGSVILGALLGILSILLNTWSWLEIHVLLTTVILASASLCGLACDLAKSPLGRNRLSTAGKIAIGLATFLLLIGLWVEIESDFFWNTSLCVSFLAIAIVHVCLLSIAKLPRRFQWVYFIGSQLTIGLALFLSMIVIFEIESDGIWRLLAVVSILVAAISLIIPILHRIGKLKPHGEELLTPMEARDAASIDQEIARLQTRIANLQRLKETISYSDLPKTKNVGLSASNRVRSSC